MVGSDETWDTHEQKSIKYLAQWEIDVGAIPCGKWIILW